MPRLFPRGKEHQQCAGEWSDLRGGSRLVRDIQARYTTAHYTYIIIIDELST